jgi:cyclophilin family peptidyl-prolyl cis-trans isomerase
MSKNWSDARAEGSTVEAFMKSVMWLMAAILLALTPMVGAQRAAGQPVAASKPSPGAGPVIVFETAKGSFEMETYPNEAPKSVAHILTLVRRNFYNGLRVHRLVPGFVVQFGDPQTRDMTKRDAWGTRGSGRAIGVAEISPKRPHRVGAVALAHAGDPRAGDSQIYIALSGLEDGRIANIQGDFTVFAQVISGMDVVRKLQETDVIRRATVKGAGRGAKAPGEK